MILSDILRFERQNAMSISVYGYQDGKDRQERFVYLLKVTKDMKEHHVDLLLIAIDDTNYYCYIKFIMPLIEIDVYMIWDDGDKDKFESATHCHVCRKELNRLTEPIVRSLPFYRSVSQSGTSTMQLGLSNGEKYL